MTPSLEHILTSETRSKYPQAKPSVPSSKPVQTHETPLKQIHITELSLARYTSYVCRETSQFDL